MTRVEVVLSSTDTTPAPDVKPLAVIEANKTLAVPLQPIAPDETIARPAFVSIRQAAADRSTCRKQPVRICPHHIHNRSSKKDDFL